VRFAFKAYRLKGKTLIEDTGLTNEGTYQAAAIPSIARYRGKSSGRTADARFAVLSYDYWENGGEMTQSTLTRNKCDAAGRLVSSDTLHSDDNYSDDSTENYYGVHTEYEYDKNGNLTAQTAYNADGTKYWGNCRTAAFDSHGNEIKTEDFDDSGNPDGGNTYTYKYDAAGNVLTKNMYYEDELVLVYKYTYDKAGHMLTQKNYRDGKLEYSEKDTWNKAGRKTAVSVIYYTDTQDLASGDGVDTVYTYDKAGHLLKAESTCTGSRKGESEGSEAYTYDDETGDCIESMNEEPVATSYDYNIYAQIDLAQ
jgi:YD repeat-containing protein